MKSKKNWNWSAIHLFACTPFHFWLNLTLFTWSSNADSGEPFYRMKEIHLWNMSNNTWNNVTKILKTSFAFAICGLSNKRRQKMSSLVVCGSERKEVLQIQIQTIAFWALRFHNHPPLVVFSLNKARQEKYFEWQQAPEKHENKFFISLLLFQCIDTWGLEMMERWSKARKKDFFIAFTYTSASWRLSWNGWLAKLTKCIQYQINCFLCKSK